MLNTKYGVQLVLYAAPLHRLRFPHTMGPKSKYIVSFPAIAFSGRCQEDFQSQYQGILDQTEQRTRPLKNQSHSQQCYLVGNSLLQVEFFMKLTLTR